MDPLVVATTFLAIFTAELPDKTMVASMVMTARTRQPRAVWLGATVAFAVHAAIAVVLGRTLDLLPDTVVSIVTGVLFLGGAVLLARDDSAVGDEEIDSDLTPRAGPRTVATQAFVLVFIAEWGDLTQLTTAGLAARTGDPAAVFVGALLALSSVAALAATAGQAILRVLPVRVVRLVAAAVFATIGAVTLASLVF